MALLTDIKVTRFTGNVHELYYEYSEMAVIITPQRMQGNDIINLCGDSIYRGLPRRRRGLSPLYYIFFYIGRVQLKRKKAGRLANFELVIIL